MPSIVFVLPDGSERTVDAAAGTSVMLAAVDHDIPGIVGECGGCASCATCHVWVDPSWVDRLPPPDEIEDDLLGYADAERRPGSRLGCQIEVDASLDGLRVEVPPVA
ncbi:MAG TPA: 2Fe-2S iron-sulfur cluster-binding protein [Burkholderiaceae bacterium]|nr:2Fe-2S iron-sulfur cluster-binding protein [Burkholderiaceae bacterium]